MAAEKFLASCYWFALLCPTSPYPLCQSIPVYHSNSDSPRIVLPPHIVYVRVSLYTIVNLTVLGLFQDCHTSHTLHYILMKYIVHVHVGQSWDNPRTVRVTMVYRDTLTWRVWEGVTILGQSRDCQSYLGLPIGVKTEHGTDVAVVN